jgi:membrane glycosyltransferase
MTEQLLHVRSPKGTFMPHSSPLRFPVRPVDYSPPVGRLPLPRRLRVRRWWVFGGSGVAVTFLSGVLLLDLSGDGVEALDLLVVTLFALNITVIAIAAATALLGLFPQDDVAGRPPADWRPKARTAVLIPIRHEDTSSIVGRLATLRKELRAAGLAATTDIFILSDSSDPLAVKLETDLADRMAGPAGVMPPRVFYRRRTRNLRRKPGNIAHWLRRYGAAYAYMLVLDADSRMSGVRVGRMVWRMEQGPQLGLLQAAIRVRPGESRFSRLQARGSGLYGELIAHGIAGWSGTEANYWGHNALIRVRAFASAAGLPQLKGNPPFGGDILSHDFVEAAWIRRSGWAVEIDPDTSGSFEGGPETLEAYHKRDRRWAQGNLQHMRLIGAQGLSPISRLHLANGIMGYLAAPFWIALVVTIVLFAPDDPPLWPMLAAIGLLLVPRLVAVISFLRRRRGFRSRTVFLRAVVGELLVSAIVAPIFLVRQSLSVLSILAGRDCGWKPAGGASSQTQIWLEPVAATILLLAAWLRSWDASNAALVLPLALPLLFAPLIGRWLDAKPRPISAVLGLPRLPEPQPQLAVQR